MLCPEQQLAGGCALVSEPVQLPRPRPVSVSCLRAPPHLHSVLWLLGLSGAGASVRAGPNSTGYLPCGGGRVGAPGI